MASETGRSKPCWGRGLADQTRVLGRQVQPERRREVPGRDRRWVRFQARTGSPARAIFLAIAKPIVPPTPSTAIASDISIRACYPLLRLLHADAEVYARSAGKLGYSGRKRGKMGAGSQHDPAQGGSDVRFSLSAVRETPRPDLTHTPMRGRVAPSCGDGHRARCPWSAAACASSWPFTGTASGSGPAQSGD